jgi:hypothetical protein
MKIWHNWRWPLFADADLTTDRPILLHADPPILNNLSFSLTNGYSPVGAWSFEERGGLKTCSQIFSPIQERKVVPEQRAFDLYQCEVCLGGTARYCQVKKYLGV